MLPVSKNGNVYFVPCLIESEQEIFDAILKSDLDFSTEPWPSISESAKDLVRKMLVRDPSKRLTAFEVLRKFLYCYPIEMPVKHELLGSIQLTSIPHLAFDHILYIFFSIE